MRKMSDCFIDLTITSPPYDNLRDYKGYSFDFENIANELYRITKEGGVLIWIVGDATIKGSETGSSFKQALYFKRIGFNLHDTMIYRKTGTPFPSQARYNQTFEYMFVLSKGNPKTFNPLMKRNITSGSFRKRATTRLKDGTKQIIHNRQTNEYGVEDNIWLIKNGSNKSSKDKAAFLHPAIFPEELAAKHIKSWSNKGELIYDCFMGSGSTGKACALEGFNFVGIELDKDYCEIAKARIDKAIEDKRIMESQMKLF